MMGKECEEDEEQEVDEHDRGEGRAVGAFL